MNHDRKNPGLNVEYRKLHMIVIDKEAGLRREMYLLILVDKWTGMIVDHQIGQTPSPRKAMKPCIERMFRELKGGHKRFRLNKKDGDDHNNDTSPEGGTTWIM